ncbi:MAG: putative lipid II flippase FtsW [Anaerovoracaceae bacterium]
MTKKRRLGSADFVLVVMTLAMVSFGVIMVFSASYYGSIDQYGNPYYYLIKDMIWACTGFVMMIGTMIIDYHKYRKWGNLLMAFAVVLLILVLVAGQEVNGATRWIGFGPITIMPGELTKICVIIFVASFLCGDVKKVNNFSKGILPLLVLCGVVGALILKQPNMSTAITVVGIVVAMMFVAGLEMKYFAGLMGLGIVGAIGIILAGGGYKLARATSFLDPFKDQQGDGYQVVQGLLALGSGGLFGTGLGKSLQKNLYLPEAQNDFILAIIGEELGFIAIIVLFAVYLFMIWRGIKIALAAPDRFGMLLASGITMMIGIQLLLNVAVVTSSMPPTGVTLPFISYGGNATWLFMGSMGILLNISRQIPKEENK